jgi:hypothetical protein
MAYLGNAPARNFISFERQVFTIVNSQTAYTLDHSVNNENDIRLVVNNVVQEPGSGKAYTASGTTLTLSAALVNGTDEMYCVFLGRAVATNAPGAGSVGTSQLASDAVTEAKIADAAVESEHLNNNVISGQTELAAEPADTDEFLISDAGTLKRIDYSHIKATSGLSMVDQWRLTADKTNVGTSNTVFDSNLEQIDTGGQTTVGTAMSESSGVFTFPATGKYLIIANTNFYRTSDIRFCKLQIDIGISGTYTQLAQGYGHIKVVSSGATYSNVMCTTIVNIGNTSNDTVRFVGSGNAEVTAEGSTTTNRTTFTFIKLD